MGILHQGADSYVLLSRSRLVARRRLVPLACLKHAASVRPGPGSNPQIVTSLNPARKIEASASNLKMLMHQNKSKARLTLPVIS